MAVLLSGREWGFVVLLGLVLAAALWFLSRVLFREIERFEKGHQRRARALREMYLPVPKTLLVLASVASMLLFYHFFAWYFHTWAAGVAGGAIGLLVPARAVRWWRRRYLARIEEQFPEALGVLANGVAAGLGLRQAIAEAARESPAPLCHELRRVNQEETHFGTPTAEAVEHLAQRLGTEDMRLFAAAVSLNRKAGVGLREGLTTLATTIRERQRVRGKVKALTAHGRLQAVLVALIPFGAFLLMAMIDSEMTMRLFEIRVGALSAGRLLLAGVVAVELVAFLWIRRIVTIDV